MNTTDLFVELIIIGVGALAWIGLFALAIFGLDVLLLSDQYAWIALIPILSLTYVLGIVIDRMADRTFGRLWEPALFDQYYTDKDQFYNDRRLIYVSDGRLSNLMEYGRSRLRICRGWGFNSFWLLIATLVFTGQQITVQPLRANLMIFGSLFWVLLGLGCWFTWRRLTLNDYRRTRDQSAFLREHVG